MEFGRMLTLMKLILKYQQHRLNSRTSKTDSYCSNRVKTVSGRGNMNDLFGFP